MLGWVFSETKEVPAARPLLATSAVVARDIVEASDSGGDLPPGGVPRFKQYFSVLTWNIWFDARSLEQRTEKIARKILEDLPDFVCLQEVTHKAEQLLTVALHHDYDSDPFPNAKKWYYCKIYARKSLGARFSETAFPTSMDRSLLSAVVDVTVIDPGGLSADALLHPGLRTLCVSTAHFESLNSHSTREKQLQIAHEKMSAHDQSILVGDFNFCSYRNFDDSNRAAKLENDSLSKLLPEYMDVWPELVQRKIQHNSKDAAKEAGNKKEVRTETDAEDTKASKKEEGAASVVEERADRADDSCLGYTFDTDTNVNLAGHRTERMRYDRVLVRRGKAQQGTQQTEIVAGQIRPTSIVLLGTELIGHDSRGPLFCSDHYGILTAFIIE